MSRDRLLFQVELLPPSASNVKTVSSAIDKLTKGQKQYNQTLEKGSQTLEEQQQNYKKYRQEIRKIKTSVGEAENQARFFDASTEDATKSIQAQANQLDKLRSEINGANLSTQDRIRLQDKLQTRMRSVQLSQQKVRTGWKGMAVESKRGNQILLDTGRILQDLPYGIIGISNNIEQLALSFRRGHDDIGGFRGVLQSVKKSFMGSGGMLFLLGSALPFALTIASNGFIGFKNILGDSKSEAELLQKRINGLEGGLKDLVSASAGLRDTDGVLGIGDIESKLRGLDTLVDTFDAVIINQEKINELESSHAQTSYYGSEVVDDTVDRLQKIIDHTMDYYGLNQDQLENLRAQRKALKDMLAIKKARVKADPVLQLKQSQLNRATHLIEKFEHGIRRFQETAGPGFERTINTVAALREEEEKLADKQDELQRKIEQGTASEDTMAKLKVTTSTLEMIREKLEEIPEKPTIAPEVKEPKIFEEGIQTDIGISFDEAADFGKKWQKRLDKRAKARTKFLQESRAQAFEMRKEMATDVVSLRMSTRRQLQNIDDRARELGLQNHKVIEDLKTAVTRRHVQKRFELFKENERKRLKREKQLADSRMGIAKHAANFIGSINSALAEKSKEVALIELAISKGLKIAEVWTSAAQKTGELDLEAAVQTAKATAATMTGNFFKAGQHTSAATALAAQKGTVNASAAKTTALIAGTGLMKGIGIASGGGGSAGGGGGASAGGGGGGKSRGASKFKPGESEGINEDELDVRPIEDRQDITPGRGTNQEITVVFEGEISEEMINVKSVNGRKRRESRSVKILSD